MSNKRQNKALHPTASVPLVPRFTPAAGELGRCAGARYFSGNATAKQKEGVQSNSTVLIGAGPEKVSVIICAVDASGTLFIMKPLVELISERGFDRFQSGLTARFSAYELKYQLTYCEATENSAMRLDFESPLHVGRVTVWESGACDLEVLDVSTGQIVFKQHHQLNSETEFHHTYPDMVIFMRDALGKS